MNEPVANDRQSWLQFNLRSLFLLTLLVAVFLAGRLSRQSELNRLRDEMANVHLQAESNRLLAQQAIDQMIEQLHSDLLAQATPTADVHEEQLQRATENSAELGLPAPRSSDKQDR